MPSLRRQLTTWLLAPLVVLWGINAWVTYQTALESANRAHDRTLLGSVLAIAERTAIIDGKVVVDLPYSALEMLESNLQSRIYYRVSESPNRTITGYEDLPAPTAKMESGKTVFYDTDYRGERVRVAAVSRRFYDEAAKDAVLIQVAETAELRQSMSRQILFDSVTKELVLILLAAALMWLAVNRGLRPLEALRDQVHHRDRTDLSPIDAPLVPIEVKPLIEAINEHTARLAQMISAQKQFIADAAHQLKTPLTLLRTQADFASRQSDMAAVSEVINDLRKNTGQVSHLVEQLLTLNRAEADSNPHLLRVDLTDLARRTTFQRLPLALKKSIDLGFEGEQPLPIMGNEFLLQELLNNLLDNAIRFTPESGHITVSVTLRDTRVMLTVEDSGPGIPQHERDRVFDRFYQIPERDTSGCGLGLAIVREICTLHHAAISIHDTVNGVGALFNVAFAHLAEEPFQQARVTSLIYDPPRA